jgi:hypothetical protein
MSEQLTMRMEMFQEQPPALAGGVREGYCRHADPETSRKAAAKVKAGSIAARILDWLRAYPEGLTNDELAAKLEVKLVSVSPRMKPLRLAGSIRKNGERNGATVWTKC